MYTLWPAPGHVHPKLRLKERSALISLAGGIDGLPVTDAAARATPLDPAQWRDMLRGAAAGANGSVAAEAADPVSGARGRVVGRIRGAAGRP